MNKVKHLIEPDDLTNSEIESLISKGMDIYDNPKNYSDVCKGKIMASLFFEPSTRTKFSFDSAMIRLGGNVIGFSDASTSSTSKGESLADTIKVMSFYSDIIVMRHPKEGAPKLASMVSEVPIINGGDGGHQHPTQTLTDLITIKRFKGNITNHTIGFCGDLKHGRTVHSLIKTLSRFEGNNFILVSPKELRLPEGLKYQLTKQYGTKFTEVETLDEVMDKLDVLYMTRIQKERFFNEEDYLRLKNSYILTNDKISNAKANMIIMHPLPRVNEISYEIDDDPRSVYFEQSRMGVFVRMALITTLLEEAK
ncbi:aspartate carbamoyltransferase [Helicovermis profundi]|uniref:Aspartate carbamoyltransferase n=1 Tax=Helicovermis profundi TaxID=3065157 RepID=A0AAU9EB90_9FIRM|nr:aspartate carbamoyltransferase [Clostridia bacterium S502]